MEAGPRHAPEGKHDMRRGLSTRTILAIAFLWTLGLPAAGFASSLAGHEAGISLDACRTSPGPAPGAEDFGDRVPGPGRGQTGPDAGFEKHKRFLKPVKVFLGPFVDPNGWRRDDERDRPGSLGTTPGRF